jgi:aspartyl/glutamyl-tRNA(Asn/Gln) amidotransferase C subunit
MSTQNIDELLDKLLTLSRLTLDESEREEFARKFQSLLEFVNKVNESDAAMGVGRAEAAGSLSYFEEMPLRNDTPEDFKWRDDFVHNYIVPIVVGGSDADSANGESE